MAKRKTNNITKMFNAPKTSHMTRPEGAGNFDNMDDYNIVESIDLIEGTIQHIPTQPKHLANKEYVDKTIGYADDAFNIDLVTPDVEVSQLLPTGTNKVRFKIRTDLNETDVSYLDTGVPVPLRWSWETGKVASEVSPYFTLDDGMTHMIVDVFLENVTIYFAIGSANAVVEMETWE